MKTKLYKPEEFEKAKDIPEEWKTVKDKKEAVIEFVKRADEGKPYFGLQVTKKFSTGGAVENYNDQVKRKYGGGKL